jgi:uracil-DNA glycosylase
MKSIRLLASHLHHRVPVHHISRLNMSLKRKAADLAADDAKKPKQNSFVPHHYTIDLPRALIACRSITSFFKAPKEANSSSNGAGSATAKFDKAAWVAKLTPEQKELLQLEIDTMDESWLFHLKEELVSPQFLELKRFLKKEWGGSKKVFPPKEDIYSWYALKPFPHISSISTVIDLLVLFGKVSAYAVPQS